MRRLMILVSAALSSFVNGSTDFPRLSLYPLKGEMQSLPSGQKELVFVGCKSDARHSLKRWYQLLCEHPLAIGRLGVRVVPVFPSFMAHQLFRPSLMALIRQRIPEHLSHHVGVLFSNVEEMASLFDLSCRELEQLQIFLIDEHGAILWKASGDPTSQKIGQLQTQVATYFPR